MTHSERPIVTFTVSRVRLLKVLLRISVDLQLHDDEFGTEAALALKAFAGNLLGPSAI